MRRIDSPERLIQAEALTARAETGVRLSGSQRTFMRRMMNAIENRADPGADLARLHLRMEDVAEDAFPGDPRLHDYSLHNAIKHWVAERKRNNDRRKWERRGM